MATTSGTCPTATHPRASPTTDNSGDSYHQWDRDFWACDGTKTSPSGANSVRAEAAGNTSDVDVEQQLLGESAGGDSDPAAHLPDVHLRDVC